METTKKGEPTAAEYRREWRNMMNWRAVQQELYAEGKQMSSDGTITECFFRPTEDDVRQFHEELAATRARREACRG